MKGKIRNESDARRRRRHLSIRRRIVGTPERPRVCVYRSNAHIYAQIIDDTTGRTIASVSSLRLDPSALAAPPAGDGEKKKGKGKAPRAQGRKVLQARAVGRLLAETAKEKGIGTIAFDRAGYLFHGRVAALAEAAREGGLVF
jgi:large subunit ribosomal protein L18